MTSPPCDIETLRRYQRNVTGKEYIKVTGILMLSKGLSVETVSDSLGIDTATVYRYWNSYKGVGKTVIKGIGVCSQAKR